MVKFKIKTNFKISPKISDMPPERQATIKKYAQCSSLSQIASFYTLLYRMEQAEREYNRRTIKGRFKNLWHDIKKFFKRGE
jgi:hypothetical protein